MGITSISKIHKIENREEQKISSMEAFLNSLNKKTTRSTYKRGVELFVTWYSKTVDEILAERKDDLTPRPNESPVDSKQRADRYEKLLEKFYFWLEEQGYDNKNTRYSFCKGLRQLFRYYNMGITLRTGSPINQVTPKTDDFPLKGEHVKKMFHVAKDLRSKLLVSMGNDLGWRISDVLSIKRNELPNLNQEPPIEWVRITQKENQVSKTCLSRTTVLLLKEYMFAFPNEHNPHLFFSNGGTIDDETVNRRLKDLAEDAEIELGNLSLSWHCFRKMIISTAKNLGVDPDIIKLMVGKSVERSMLPYLNGIDVRSAFMRLQTVLGITSLAESSEDVTKNLKEQVEKLKDSVRQVEVENLSYRTRVESLQMSISELASEVETIRGLVSEQVEFGNFKKEEKEALRQKYNLREYTPEERQRGLEFRAWLKELSDKEGCLDEEGAEELRKRIKAKLGKGEWKVKERQ
jgi:hypothetical protein